MESDDAIDRANRAKRGSPFLNTDQAAAYLKMSGRLLKRLRVRGDGSQVAPVALVEAGVDWPRHHAVVRDTLLVAGQLSDEVVAMPLDIRSGVPGRIRHRAETPSPTQLLPLA